LLARKLVVSLSTMLSPLTVVWLGTAASGGHRHRQNAQNFLYFCLEAVWRLIWQGCCRYCRRQLVMQPFAELWGGPRHKLVSTCSSTMSRFGPKAASNSRSFGTALSCISRQGITAYCYCCMSRKAFLRGVYLID